MDTNKAKQSNKHRMEFNDGNQTLGWLEKLLQLLSTFGIKKMIQACFFFVAFFLGNILFNAVQNESVVEKLLVSLTTNHIENADIRNEINPKVNNQLIRLLYDLKGDRTFIMEMHNGKENPTSLPFLYCDMTYEEVNESKRIPYINNEYENLNMSKFTLPSYLYEHRFFIGSIDDLYEIDKKLAVRMETNDIKYCGFILIKSGIEIGFLGISYQEIPDCSEDKIHAKLGDYVQEISFLLDLSKQKAIRGK
jgi:hypothetical protein